MELGMIGLGRMGGNMTKRLAADGHDVKTYDPGVESMRVLFLGRCEPAYWRALRHAKAARAH